MEFHEIANIFPMMTGDDYNALKDDIAANGLIESVVIYEGKILDGRNRYRACKDLDFGLTTMGVDTYDGDDPFGYVISKNLHRRHLNTTQRAVIAARLVTMPVGRNWNNSANLQNKISQPEASEMLNVSTRSLASVNEVMEGAPDLLPAMESGEMTVNKAIQTMRKREVVADLESIEIQEAKAIEGVYDVIVIDPPWPMEKIERNVAPQQVSFEYPTMSIEEIKELIIPAADNCHIWLWTTQKFLPAAFETLRYWCANYICSFVWHKPGGFQPFGLPQYNCEFVLYARLGVPIFIDLKDFFTCFDAPRGNHSVKPDEFYNVVRRVTAGRRLDMFNRRPIDGFDGWGKEA